ncbi:MAG: polymer-forming cytoskeletal protein [Betaproteobacteria bacterium]
MLNMGRRDRLFDPKDADKGTKPPFPAGTGAPTPAPAAVGRAVTPGPLTRDAAAAAASAAPAPASVVTTPAAPLPAPAADTLAPAADAGAESVATSIGPDTPGSRLCVGPKIKLKGVEISDCDVLVVEGEVEATVNSKAMQIAKPGTLKGHVSIDIAEIFGDFSGELTARTKLIVHATGRVSGKIRYGKLIVAEGGELSGDVQRLDANGKSPAPRAGGNEAFSLAAPETAS